MRQKHNNTLPGFFHNDQRNDENENKTLQIVRRFRDEYKRVDEQLTKYPTPAPNARHSQFVIPTLFSQCDRWR